MATEPTASGGIDVAAKQIEEEKATWRGLLDGPSPWANRLSVNHLTYSEAMRISFAEWHEESDETKWRAAVTISGWTAFQLWDLLGKSELVRRWAAQQAEPPVGE